MANSQNNDVKFVSIEFNLPFLVMVEDSLVPGDDLNNQYLIKVDGIPAFIRFKKMVREEEGVAIALQDKRGLLTYSKTQVCFEEKFFTAFNIELHHLEHRETFIAQAIIYISHFLDIYRDVTCEFWIRPISKKEVKSFNIIVKLWNGTIERHIYGKLGTGKGLGGRAIDHNMDEVLRSRLLEEIYPDDKRRLELQAHDAIDREEYSLATIYIAIYFEMVNAFFIRKALSSQGVSGGNIDEYFENKRGGPLSELDLLKRNVPNLTRVNLESGNHPIKIAFDKWKDKVRPLRNELAHGKVITVSSGQAKECFDIVFTFLTEFKKGLEDNQLL